MAVFGVHDDLGQVKGKVSNGNGWNEAFPNHQMRKGIKLWHSTQSAIAIVCKGAKMLIIKEREREKAFNYNLSA